MPSQDIAWLIAARKLNARALTAIFDAYSEELYEYAFRLIGDASHAEDLMSETFNRFLRALERGSGPETHLRAYLYRITHNLAMDLLRRDNYEVLDDQIGSRPELSGHTPEQVVERRIEQEQALALLMALTSDQKQVLLLKFFQGMGNEEIAETMCKTVGAVKALQHRALVSLRCALERRYFDSEKAA